VSNLANMLGFLLVVNGLVLLFLQIFANYNFDEQIRRKKELNAISFNWFMHDAIYNSYGKRACIVARYFWLVSIPLIVLWLYLRY
jgi:hypothetical protein